MIKNEKVSPLQMDCWIEFDSRRGAMLLTKNEIMFGFVFATVVIGLCDLYLLNLVLWVLDIKKTISIEYGISSFTFKFGY